MSLKREACLINGEWITSDRWMEIDDPATGAIIGRVPDLGSEAARQAIAAAVAAQGAWAARTAQERARLLQRFYQLILDHQDELAHILTEEQGKPIAEALAEIVYAASFVEWFAEEGKRVYGDIIPTHAADKRLLVMKQPVGVVAAITPWNFPAAMVTRKIAPALAAGCAVVVKPAPQTPFTALALGALGLEAGLAPGLLNVVTGDAGAIGAELTGNFRIRKISFTGSTPVGVKLFAQSAPTIKKLSLELGGNAPFIIFDDADVDAAVQGALQSKYRNAGQTCVCPNRFYAQDGVYEEFVGRLAAASAALKVGHGLTTDVQVGPLIDEMAIAKVERHVADALAKGATLLTGGARHPLGARFYQPTVLGDITPSMIITQEETFGPVAAVSRFCDDVDAVRLANATESGLAAYFYARDVGRIWRVAEEIEAGMIGINTGLISTEVAPFGGIKSSGLGREGSRYGIEDYLQTKYLCLGL